MTTMNMKFKGTIQQLRDFLQEAAYQATYKFGRYYEEYDENHD